MLSPIFVEKLVLAVLFHQGCVSHGCFALISVFPRVHHVEAFFCDLIAVCCVPFRRSVLLF